MSHHHRHRHRATERRKCRTARHGYAARRATLWVPFPDPRWFPLLQVVAVVGRIGSGKSSLIQALLGNMVRHRGAVQVGRGGCAAASVTCMCILLGTGRYLARKFLGSSRMHPPAGRPVRPTHVATDARRRSTAFRETQHPAPTPDTPHLSTPTPATSHPSGLHPHAPPPQASSRVSYVPQNPWLQNLSIRESVLFGTPYDEKRYNAVIEACALTMDLDILPQGDETK